MAAKIAPEVSEAQQQLNRALELLRSRRDKAGHSEEGRRLNAALTQLELGCMMMNMSQFSDHPYTPIIVTQ